MITTNNLRVRETNPLLTPDQIRAELPLSDSVSELVSATREQIREILWGRDPRLLVVVGPCSIHDPAAALDYATRLARLKARFLDQLLIVMRVYFEKPRTTVGWKGLINDPNIDGSYDILLGLRMARGVLLGVAELGLGTASEMLDPNVPQYTAELVSWSAIGARTTESQTHRELASGLSMPVGFKNATDGGIDVAVNAIVSAARPHHFLGVDEQGRVSIIGTTGNPDCHLVLRGGSSGPNYDAASLAAAASRLAASGGCSRIMVDCSHDNSGKNHERQPEVLREVTEQLSAGSPHIAGVMIESHIVAGCQKPAPRDQLVYGQSITDACVDLDTTERMLEELARGMKNRRRCAA